MDESSDSQRAPAAVADSIVREGQAVAPAGPPASSSEALAEEAPASPADDRTQTTRPVEEQGKYTSAPPGTAQDAPEPPSQVTSNAAMLNAMRVMAERGSARTNAARGRSTPEAYTREKLVQQKNQIALLRYGLRDLVMLGETVPMHPRVMELVEDDEVLHKFLLYHQYSKKPLADAEKMFRDHVQFRFVLGMATTIHNEWKGQNGLPLSARARLGSLMFYADFLPYLNVNGGLIGVACVGKADWEGLSRDEYALECMKMTHMLFAEDAWRFFEQSSKECRSMTIIDGLDISVASLGYISTILAVMNSCQTLYPDTMEKCLIINSGWAVNAMWTALSPFLPHRFRETVELYDEDYLDVVGSIVGGDKSKIPEQIGGNLKLNGFLPIKSVTEAYSIVVNEIITQGVNYRDKDEFLAAALQHSNDCLWDQTVKIKQYQAKSNGSAQYKRMSRSQIPSDEVKLPDDAGAPEEPKIPEKGKAAPEQPKTSEQPPTETAKDAGQTDAAPIDIPELAVPELALEEEAMAAPSGKSEILQ